LKNATGAEAVFLLTAPDQSTSFFKGKICLVAPSLVLIAILEAKIMVHEEGKGMNSNTVHPIFP
jgi:hypothetical protein